MHFAGISMSVWGRNRAAARAFRDPLLDGGFPFLPSVIRSAHLRRLAVLAGSGALLVGIVFAATRLPFGGRAEVSPAADPLAGIPDSKASVTEIASLTTNTGAQAGTALDAVPAASAALPAAGAISALPADGAPGMASTAPAAETPAEAPTFPEKGYHLLACKRDRTLYVYRRDGTRWQKVAAFPMAIGRNYGDKSDEGDNRTPEGRFWITGVLPGPSQGPIYGPLVFTLNYPRPGDRAEGKTGQGIWIHGVEAGRLPTYTHGCLSLANEDVLALSGFADAGTPLLILADSLAPDPARQADLAGMRREYPGVINAYGRRTREDTLARERMLAQAAAFVAKEAKDFPELTMESVSQRDKQAILARLERWRVDWTGRDIERYAQNYDQDFRDRHGRRLRAFLDRKERIFASKTSIQMEIGEPKIESEGYARVKVTFRQDYLAVGPQGPQRSSGPKTLRLESGPGGWLIITE